MSFNMDNIMEGPTPYEIWRESMRKKYLSVKEADRERLASDYRHDKAMQKWIEGRDRLELDPVWEYKDDGKVVTDRCFPDDLSKILF